MISVSMFRLGERWRTKNSLVEVTISETVEDRNARVALNTASAVDRDGDGMSDDWEILHGMNPVDDSDRLSDFDRDGVLAFQEYDVGTNPNGEWSLELLDLSEYGTLSGLSDFNTHKVELADSGVLLVTGSGQDSDGVYRTQAWVKFDEELSYRIPIPPVSVNPYSFRVNDYGQVVFHSGASVYFWAPGMKVSELVPHQVDVPSEASSYLSDFNNLGEFLMQVVDFSNYGNSYSSYSYSYVVSIDGTVVVETDDNGFGYGLNSITGINNYGEVIGVYVDPDLLGRNRTFAYLGLGSFNFITNFSTDFPEYENYQSVNQSVSKMNDFGVFYGNYYAWDPDEDSESGSYYFDGNYNKISYKEETRQYFLGLSDDREFLLKGYTPGQGWEHRVLVDDIQVELGKLSKELTKEYQPTASMNGAGVIVGWKKIHPDGNEYSRYILRKTQDDDQDGMSNDWENFYGFDQHDASDAFADEDGDGLSNLAEYHLKKNPLIEELSSPDGGTSIDQRPGIDTDGDGMPNVWEIRYSLDYLDPADAALDYDRDGYTNLQEFELDTTPIGPPSFVVQDVQNPNDGSMYTRLFDDLGGVISVSHSASNYEVIRQFSNEGVEQTQRFESAAYPSLFASSATGVFVGASYPENTRLPTIWSMIHDVPISYPTPSGRHGYFGDVSLNGRYSVAVYNQLNSRNWMARLEGGKLVACEILGGDRVFGVPAINNQGDIIAAVRFDDGKYDIAVWENGEEDGVRFGANTYLSTPQISKNGNLLAAWVSKIDAIEKLQILSGSEVVSVDLPLGKSFRLTALNQNFGVGNFYQPHADGRMRQRAFLLENTADDGWVFSELPTPVDEQSTALDCNENGEIIGSIWKSNDRKQTLWRKGFQRFNLEDVCNIEYRDLEFTQAFAISNTGDIAMRGRVKGEDAAFVLRVNFDVDGDFLPDEWEIRNGYNPLSAHDGNDDRDHDGLSTLIEYRIGSSPSDSDTDGDGMPDGWESDWGLDPLEALDAFSDPDKDKVPNLTEFNLGTSPTGLYHLSDFALSSEYEGYQFKIVDQRTLPAGVAGATSDDQQVLIHASNGGSHKALLYSLSDQILIAEYSAIREDDPLNFTPFCFLDNGDVIGGQRSYGGSDVYEWRPGTGGGDQILSPLNVTSNPDRPSVRLVSVSPDGTKILVWRTRDPSENLPSGGVSGYDVLNISSGTALFESSVMHQHGYSDEFEASYYFYPSAITNLGLIVGSYHLWGNGHEQTARVSLYSTATHYHQLISVPNQSDYDMSGGWYWLNASNRIGNDDQFYLTKNAEPTSGGAIQEDFLIDVATHSAIPLKSSLKHSPKMIGYDLSKRGARIISKNNTDAYLVDLSGRVAMSGLRLVPSSGDTSQSVRLSEKMSGQFMETATFGGDDQIFGVAEVDGVRSIWTLNKADDLNDNGVPEDWERMAALLRGIPLHEIRAIGGEVLRKQWLTGNVTGNKNSQPDSSQALLDRDRDGVPDIADAHPLDKVINWEKGTRPRFLVHKVGLISDGSLNDDLTLNTERSAFGVDSSHRFLMNSKGDVFYDEYGKNYDKRGRYRRKKLKGGDLGYQFPPDSVPLVRFGQGDGYDHIPFAYGGLLTQTAVNSGDSLYTLLSKFEEDEGGVTQVKQVLLVPTFGINGSSSDFDEIEIARDSQGAYLAGSDEAILLGKGNDSDVAERGSIEIDIRGTTRPVGPPGSLEIPFPGKNSVHDVTEFSYDRGSNMFAISIRHAVISDISFELLHSKIHVYAWNGTDYEVIDSIEIPLDTSLSDRWQPLGSNALRRIEVSKNGRSIKRVLLGMNGVLRVSRGSSAFEESSLNSLWGLQGITQQGWIVRGNELFYPSSSMEEGDSVWSSLLNFIEPHRMTTQVGSENVIEEESYQEVRVLEVKRDGSILSKVTTSEGEIYLAILVPAEVDLKDQSDKIASAEPVVPDKFRATNLQGRNLTEKAPQQEAEVDLSDERMRVDVYTRQLRYDTSHAYTEVPASDLSLQVTQSLSTSPQPFPSVVQDQDGNLGSDGKFDTKKYALSVEASISNAVGPFGFGWSSNLGGRVEFKAEYVPEAESDHGTPEVSSFKVKVIDESGRTHSFHSDDLEKFQVAPSRFAEADSFLMTLERLEPEQPGGLTYLVLTKKFGTKLFYRWSPPIIDEDDPLGFNANLGAVSQATLVRVEDRYGNVLNYEHSIPTGLSDGSRGVSHVSVAGNSRLGIRINWLRKSAASGHVAFKLVDSIVDVRGKKTEFEYKWLTVGGGRIPVLKEVRKPDGGVVQYHYVSRIGYPVAKTEEAARILEFDEDNYNGPDTGVQLEDDIEYPESELLDAYFHVNLASVTNEANQTYQFTYEPDDSVDLVKVDVQATASVSPAIPQALRNAVNVQLLQLKAQIVQNAKDALEKQYGGGGSHDVTSSINPDGPSYYASPKFGSPDLISAITLPKAPEADPADAKKIFFRSAKPDSEVLFSDPNPPLADVMDRFRDFPIQFLNQDESDDEALVANDGLEFDVEVEDAEGLVTKYGFTNMLYGVRPSSVDDEFDHAGIVLGEDHQETPYMPQAIAYQTLVVEKIRANDELPTHRTSYTFEPAAGFALKRSIDINGRVVEYDFSNEVSDGAAVATGMAGLSFTDDSSGEHDQVPVFGLFSDPTEKRRLASTAPDAEALVTKYEYQGKYRIMSKIVDPRGVTTVYEVDQLGRRTSEKIYASEADADAGGDAGLFSHTSYDYHPTRKGFRSRTTRHQIPGFETDPSFPWLSDLVTESEPDADGRAGQTTTDPGGLNLTSSTIYDSGGNVTSSTDARGNTTRFRYDSVGRLVETTFPGPEAHTKRTFYDKAGRQTKVIDENGNASLFEYDHLGRVSRSARDMNGNQRIDDGDLITSTEYNHIGQPTKVTDPNGNHTWSDYDDLHRLDSLNDALGNITTFYYGENSGTGLVTDGGYTPTRTRDARGYISETVFDDFYRPVVTRSEHTQPDGARFDIERDLGGFALSESFYDDGGNVTDTKVYRNDTDFLHTQSVYDPLNRVTSVTVGVGNAETHQHTSETHYTSTGLAWKSLAYAGHAHLERESQTDYDGAGRAFIQWSPDPATGQVNRDHTGNPLIGSPVVFTTYDENGNVRYVEDSLEIVTETIYDERNRPIVVKQPHVHDSSVFPAELIQPTTCTSYDGVGNVLSVTDPRGVVTESVYDSANRVVQVIAASGRAEEAVSSSEYDLNGNIIAATDANGNITRNHYDALNRLVATVVNPDTGNPSLTLGDEGGNDIVVANRYDASGNLIEVADGEAGKAWDGSEWSFTYPNGHITRFAFDGFGRQTKRIWDAGSSLAKVETSTYDSLLLVEALDPKGQLKKTIYDDLHRPTQTQNYTKSGAPARTEDNILNVYQGSPSSNASNQSGPGPLIAVLYPNTDGTYPDDTFSSYSDMRDVRYQLDYLDRTISETSARQTHTCVFDKNGNRILVNYGQGGRSLYSRYDALNRLTHLGEKNLSITAPADWGADADRWTHYGYDANGNTVLKHAQNTTVTERSYDALNRPLKVDTYHYPG
ncbi:MAG: hypothetical protein ABF328_02740, partial [Akkermansiaceae bacterium]